MRTMSHGLGLCAAVMLATTPVAAQSGYEGNIWPKQVDITRYIDVYDGDDTVRRGEMTVAIYFEVNTDYIVYPTVEITTSDISVNWTGAKSVADYQSTFPGREPNFTDTSQASAETRIRSRAESVLEEIRGEVESETPDVYEPGAHRIDFSAFDRPCQVTLYISEGGGPEIGGALGENLAEQC